MAGTTKMTDERKARVIANLRRGLTRGAAAESAGISRKTLTNHMQADPDFKVRMIEAEDAAVDEIEAVLFDKAKAGDVRSIIHFLKCRRPEVWAEVSRVQLAGGMVGFTKQDLEDQLKEYDNIFEALAATEPLALAGEIEDEGLESDVPEE